MGMFVSGFPTHVAGLKFEYIWTYPNESKYVGNISSPGADGIKNPSHFDDAMYVLKILLSKDPYKD